MTKRRDRDNDRDDRYGNEDEERHHRHRHKHHPNDITGRFAGVYYIHPETGEFIVADQQVPVSTAITAPSSSRTTRPAPSSKAPLGPSQLPILPSSRRCRQMDRPSTS